MFLLDTHIVSYFLRGNSAALNKRINNSARDALAISIVSAGDLHYDLQRLRPSQHARKLAEQLHELTEVVAVHELPVLAARHYGSIKAGLHAAGTPIRENDLWIAAHALAADMTLVTNNLREFQRVPGLKLENWVEA
jgi:tRNA(fMet)-specific endonuclease VapC